MHHGSRLPHTPLQRSSGVLSAPLEYFVGPEPARDWKHSAYTSLAFVDYPAHVSLVSQQQVEETPADMAARGEGGKGGKMGGRANCHGTPRFCRRHTQTCIARGMEAAASMCSAQCYFTHCQPQAEAVEGQARMLNEPNERRCWSEGNVAPTTGMSTSAAPARDASMQQAQEATVR